MRAFIPFRFCGFVTGALVAGLLSFATPIAAQAQSAALAEAQPRGFVTEPASRPVNVGNPASQSGPQQRVALVIGNSNYRNVTQLPNPANDARAVSQLLNSAGFEVIQATDLNHDEMIDVLRSFSAKIAEKGPNTVAFVYYGGHGVQIDGDNYLIPVDATITGETDVANNGVRLVDVMATLQAVPSQMRVVVVDACRNNPFAGLTEASRGLAIVDAPNGSLVGYSTAPGTEALDGDGKDSPYTTAFLKLARQPDVPIEQFFKNVRIEVNQETDGRQTPWESSSLTSNFYFFGDTAQAATQQPIREVYSSASMRGRSPRDAYRYAMATDSVQSYQDFVAFYPDDPMCEYIRALLAAKLVAVAWHQAVLANSPYAYQSFYNQYPVSPYAKIALKLQHQPKVLPLYQPSNNFAPSKFSQPFKFTNLNQINPSPGQGLQQGGLLHANQGLQLINPLPGSNQGQGNGLGGSPIHNIAPGVDLAKGNGLKLDPVITGNHVTTLPTNNNSKLGQVITGNHALAGNNNGKFDPVITNNHGTGLSNNNGANLKLDHNNAVIAHENNEKFKTFEPNGNHVLNNNALQFHPITNNSNHPNLFRANNGPVLKPKPMFGSQGGFGGGNMFHGFR